LEPSDGLLGRLGRAAAAKAGGLKGRLSALREQATVVALAGYVDQLERLKWRVTRLDGKVNHALLGAPRRDDVTSREVSHALLASRVRLQGEPALPVAADVTPALVAERLAALVSRGWPAPDGLSRVLLLGPRPPDAGPLLARWPAATTLLVDGEAERTGPSGASLELLSTDPITALLGRQGAGFDAVVAVDVYQVLSPWERRSFFDLAWGCLAARGALYVECPNTAHPDVLFDTYWRHPRHLTPVSATAIREGLDALAGATTRVTGCWDGVEAQPWGAPAEARRGGSRLFALAARR
jgi:hypothetical protein